MASSTSSLLSTTHRPTASNTTASTTVEPFAITTAFPVPSDCADSFTPTTADSWEWNWGRKPASTRIHITAYIPVPLELRESSCFPAGYENRTALQFSPGVCPGGWTAYDMATLRFEDITTAQCCPSGFTLNELDYSLGGFAETEACFKATAVSARTTTSTLRPEFPFPVSTSFETVVTMQQPWHISWERSDISTLSPPPPDPTRCSTMLLKTWTPGAEVERESICSTEKRENGPSWDGVETLIIALPTTLAVLMILVVIGVFSFLKLRKERRKKQNAQQTTVNPPPIYLVQNGVVVGVATAAT